MAGRRGGRAGLDIPLVGGADGGEAGLERGRRRRWPKVFVALAVLSGLVGFPLRTELAVRRVKALDRRWQAAQALHEEHRTLLVELAEAGVPGDEDRVARARAGVLAETAARTRELLRLPRDLPLGSRVSRLRTAIGEALERRVEELETATAVPTLRTDAAVTRVERLLADVRRHWDLQPAAPATTPVLRSGRAELAALSRFLDVPTGGVRLVLSDTDGLHLVDLDRSLSQPSRLRGVAPTPCEGYLWPASLVTRPGYLAFVQCRTAHAAPLDLVGEARSLGPANLIFPSVDPEAVWLVRRLGPDGGEGTEVTEVDGAGNVRTPTSLLPPWSSPVGAVRGGLLLDSSERGPEIWDPARQVAVRRFGAPGRALAGWGDMVAWLPYDGEGKIHLTNLTTDATLVITNPPDATGQLSPEAAFSPSASRLAVVWAGDEENGEALAMVDTASGAVDVISDVPPTSSFWGPATWSPDGRWLFSGRNAMDFVSGYRPGFSDVHRLRLPIQGLSDIVAV